MNKKLFYVLDLILLIAACKDEEDPNVPPEIAEMNEEYFLGCDNHEIFDLTQSGLTSVRNFASWNDLYFYDNFEAFIVKKGGPDGETVVNEEIRIRNFLATDSRMLVTAFMGLYSFDKDGVMTQLLDAPCEAIKMAPDGSILLGVFGNDKFRKIVKLEEDNSLTDYTDDHESDSNCTPYEDFAVLDDRNIMASTCDEYIVHYRDRLYFQSFSPGDMGFPSEPISDQFLIAGHENDLIVAARSGSSFYHIVKYTAEGEWIQLKTFDKNTAMSEKDEGMFMPNITDVLVHEGKLYVSTTIGGCRGIQEFDISKNEALTDNDYRVILDPDFPSQCIEKMYVDNNGEISVLTSNSQIIQLNCN